MKIFNSITKKIEEINPIKSGNIKIYSCGPTVYDHVHIGNISSFIYADILRRVLKYNGLNVKHVMNITDVDDKTISKSEELYPDLNPNERLKKLTNKYTKIFFRDVELVGIDTQSIDFVYATKSIDSMTELIQQLNKESFAYVADDGVYFSLNKFVRQGKTYGKLTNIPKEGIAKHRILNDEYDKNNPSDFALWKKAKRNEPSWELKLDQQTIKGRPGWHIECSAMSEKALGIPFDIHTGGIDLKFPHHENEIAQSTATLPKDSKLANVFFHNEHLLVNGKKMSKKYNNFFTLPDITKKGFSPMSFKVLVLQSSWQQPTNFSWDALESASSRLKDWQAMADLRWQVKYNDKSVPDQWLQERQKIMDELNNNLSTASAIMHLDKISNKATNLFKDKSSHESFIKLLKFFDDVFGLKLLESSDITKEQKDLINDREKARQNKNWALSDKIRDQLLNEGIKLNDTKHGVIWRRI